MKYYFYFLISLGPFPILPKLLLNKPLVMSTKEFQENWPHITLDSYKLQQRQ
jgi:hypothetical protein